MKIIQSYWSRPSEGAHIINGRTTGGWLTKRHQYLGMYLSCLLLRRFYSQVELITDEQGKELLIDKLQFPYTSVKICLNKLDHYPNSLWSLSKLYTYSIQKEPFIHVDNDFFAFAAFGEINENAPLIAQSPEEDDHGVYDSYLSQLQQNLAWLPSSFCNVQVQPQTVTAVNAGILGGTDTEFIRRYAIESLAIIDQNREFFDKRPEAGMYNIILEQFLFHRMASIEGKKISYIVPELNKAFDQVLSFDKVPTLSSYVHLLGPTKTNHFYCEQIEYRLRYEFPKEYKKFEQLLQKHNMSATHIINKINYNSFFRLPKFTKINSHLSYLFLNQISYSAKELRKVISRGKKNMTNNTYKFLIDLLNLEIATQKVYKVSSSRHKTRAYNLKNAYKYLDGIDKQSLLSTSFTLAGSIRVVKTYWPLEVYESPKTQVNNLKNLADPSYIIIGFDTMGPFIRDLDEADMLLSYFQDSNYTGNQLIEIIKADESNSSDTASIENEILEQYIIDFITHDLIYTGHLSIAEPAN